MFSTAATTPSPRFSTLPKPGPNAGLLRALAALWLGRGHAMLTLREGPVERCLWVNRGSLVAATSNVASETLGAMLATEGLLDAELIAPLTAEAQRRGRSFGDQLVLDRLLSPAEVAAALERQVERRFAAALLMGGHVLVQTEVTSIIEVARRPVGNLMLEMFRDRLGLEHAESLVRAIGSGKAWMWVDPGILEDAELRPWEARLARRSREPFTAHDLLCEAGNYERASRFVAGLIALQAITFESDPTRAATTARLAAVKRSVIAL